MPDNDDGPGPDQALAREARPLRQWLLRYFRKRVGDAADVEDMVQEVFARVAARESPAPIDHLGGYLLQTAASVVADQARRRSARQAEAHVPFDPELHAEQDIDPERLLNGREDLRRATAALLSLPERTRTIFILHRLEGYKHKDIASQLGISVSAVEKQIVRAVQHLTRHARRQHGS